MPNNALELACTIIKNFEGCRLTPYRDVAGYVTVGWGTLLSKDRQAPLSAFPAISQEQADAYLTREVLKALASIVRLTPVPLSSNQLAALTDFAYNLGAGNYQASTLRKCIIRGDFERVPAELAKWDKAGGIVYRGLTRRRQAETSLFMS